MSANSTPNYSNAYAEGDYRAKVHVIQKALESAYRNGKYDYDVARALDESKYWAHHNRKTHQFITINWDPAFCEFPVMDRIVSKRWFHDWVYVWEFCNEDEQFSHPHVHLIIKKVKPKSQVIREIAYTAGVDPNYVDVKEITQKDRAKVLSYMLKNRDYDKQIREEYQLFPVYSYLQQETFYESEQPMCPDPFEENQKKNNLDDQ